MERAEQKTSWRSHMLRWGLTGWVITMGGASLPGCVSKAPTQVMAVLEQGRDVVRLEQAPGDASYSHPVKLTPNEIKTILRGVRIWQRRNFFHELLMGEAEKTRAFREEEIAVLAPAISKALAQAGPGDLVFFHLGHPTESGDEETTTGWLYVRDPILHLVLSEVHDKHAPRPDISKYDRQMPNVPELPAEFNVTFEPEEYLVKVVSARLWFSPGQQEELQIDYRKALPHRNPS